MEKLPKLPKLLTETDQWILWRWDERGGKRTKVPCDADGQPASVNDPDSWMTYAGAVILAQTRSDIIAGIGFCFSDGDDFFGIDLDDCIPIAGQAREILERFAGTYMERSPSGTGIKIIGIGRKPEGSRFRTKKVEGFGQIEVYDCDRFFTITGEQYGLATELAEKQDALTWVCETFVPARQKSTEGGTVSSVEGASSLRERAQGFAGSDEDLILYLCENPKYASLWHGDFSDYGDEGQSEADAALVEQIAWLAGPFPERIDRVFRASALCREKWLDREDYRDSTIALALSGKTDFYSGGGPAQTLTAADLPTDVPGELAAAFRAKEEDAIINGVEGLAFPIPETGIIRDFVDLLGPITESPDSTIAFGALIMLSAIAGWSRQIVWGENPEPVTLYGCITGPSAVGRKTTGMRSVQSVVTDAFDKDPDALRMESGGHISGRALIEAAVGSVEVFYTKEPKVTALETIPDVEGKNPEWEEQQAAADSWREKRREILENPPPTVLVWDEFGKILNVDKDWQRDTRMELLRMYGGYHGGIKTSGKEGLKMPSGKVQMGLLATMTNDDLRRGLNASQVTDGLMGRIVFSPDGTRKPPLSRPPVKDAAYERKKEALEASLRRFREKCSTVKNCYDDWTTAANKAWDSWYNHHYEHATGLEALLFGRLQVTGVKIATLLSMAEGQPMVDEDHIALATRMVDVSIEVAMGAAESAIEAQRDRYVDAVYDAVAEGPVPLSKILERGMLNAKEAGEKVPERELRTSWLAKDARLVVEENEGKGGGHRVRRAA